jgi:hypothetical protein
MILTVNTDYCPQSIYCTALYWRDTVFIEKQKFRPVWRKFQNKVLHDLHSSPNTALKIKQRKMRWVQNVVHEGEKRSACRDFVG